MDLRWDPTPYEAQEGLPPRPPLCLWSSSIWQVCLFVLKTQLGETVDIGLKEVSHPLILALEGGSQTRAPLCSWPETTGSSHTCAVEGLGGGLLGGSCSYSSLFPFSISADPHDRGHHCWRPHSWHADCTHRLNEVYGTKCPFLGSQHRQHYTLVSKHTQPFPGNRRKIRRDLSNTIDLLSSELSSDSISYTWFTEENRTCVREQNKKITHKTHHPETINILAYILLGFWLLFKMNFVSFVL